MNDKAVGVNCYNDDDIFELGTKTGSFRSMLSSKISSAVFEKSIFAIKLSRKSCVIRSVMLTGAKYSKCLLALRRLRLVL